jgi:hypothetical protein
MAHNLGARKLREGGFGRGELSGVTHDHNHYNITLPALLGECDPLTNVIAAMQAGSASCFLIGQTAGR